MSSLNSWYKKYQMNMSPEIWSVAEFAILIYSPISVYSKLGKLDQEIDFDKYLNPYLFITGFYSAFLTYSGEIPENCDEKGVQIFKKMNTISKRNRELAAIIEEEFYPGQDQDTRCSRLEGLLDHEWPKDNTYFISRLVSYLDQAKKAEKNIRIYDLCRTIIYDILPDCLNQNTTSEEPANFIVASEYYANLRKQLSEKIIAQDSAISRFVQGLFTGSFNKRNNTNGPEACFLFVGPPGVGKTFLATTAAEYMNRPSLTLQMNAYTTDKSVHSIIGFEQTWKNAEDGKLTEYVSKNPSAVLIFDEIEKAHPDVIRLFLSILEGGKLQSLYTKMDVDFTNTIIIFTTNAGRDYYEENRNLKISSIPETTIIDALKQDKNSDGTPVMPTEILSRLAKGAIIGFDHMNPAKLVPIIKQGLQTGAELLADTYGVSCSYNESQFPYLLMYHLGSQLDARVAKERSKKFILDTVYSVAERVGETPDKYVNNEGEPISNIHFDVENDEPLAKEFLVPEDKANIIMVSYRADRQKVAEETDWYQRFDAWDTSETNEEGKQSKIIELMSEHKISAILIDPFFAIMTPEDNDTEIPLEGILHLNSRGTNVLRWLLKQNNMPPIYIMEMNEHISLVDRIDLQNQGVNGFIDFVGQTDEQCTQIVNNLVYEHFLSKKLDCITSKGRALDFSVGQQIEENCINLKLLNFKLVNNMSTEASEITISDAERPDTLFDDVIGAENAKTELQRFIQYLKNPEEYLRTGMKVSKGILLYGPPGTGKTKLAKALACEADCPFISTTGAQFVNGAKNISDVFRLARKYAPSVVFIDEIDSFAKDRGNLDNMRSTILNNLLTEMDGFSSSSDRPVFVIAATNAANAPDLNGNNIYLDPALLRRFSKKVYVDLPNTEERYKFLEMQKTALETKDYNLNALSSDDLMGFAKHTAGFSIAELENALNLAISEAATSEETLTLNLLRETFDESIYGEKMQIAPHHIKTTALHEAGHAYLCYMYKDRFKPQFATLVARGSYLGMVRQEQSEESFNYNRQEHLQRIRIKLAGRAAEIVFNGSEQGLTDGASNDLESATYFAQSLLSRYGMEEGFLPSIDPKLMLQSPLAEKYYARLNEILRNELDHAIQIISENKFTIELLADELIEKSRLDFEDIERIILQNS